MSTSRPHSLARNSLWNLLGQALPLLISVAILPVLIRDLGVNRFGLLTLAWVLVGYFGVFDLGIGRALTNLIAARVVDHRYVMSVFTTSMILLCITGIVGGVVIFLTGTWAVSTVLRIPPDLQQDALITSYVLAAGMPLVVVSSGLIGTLEAYQRFGAINMIRIPLGVFTYVSPLVCLQFSPRVSSIVAVLLAGRGIACVVFLRECLKSLPSDHSPTWDLSEVKEICQFGSWMTLSNVLSPLMANLDRFLVSSMLGVAAVAYYATPFQAVNSLAIIPNAFMAALFPVFSAVCKSDPGSARGLYVRALRWVFAVMFPASLLVVIFARDILHLWLGPEFADQSTRCLQILAIGVFLNSLGKVPFALVQGASRPDVTAKVHLAEIPIYFACALVMIPTMGITGAALAWTLRMALDTLLLMVISSSSWLGSYYPKAMTVVFVLSALPIFVFNFVSQPLLVKGLTACAWLSVSSWLSWKYLLKEEQSVLKKYVGLVYRR